MQGDHLTALVDGAAILEARDSRAAGAGEWGIIATDGWFESVEVQTPLPAIIATKDAPFVNSLGMKFVPVPGTDVLFCIHETRWRDYAAYVEDGGSFNAKGSDFVRAAAKETPDLPASAYDWDNAEAFCAWLSRKEGRTYRLPTDREWSYAVGIGEQETWNADTTPATVNNVPDQYPWGTEWPPPKGAGNFRDETFNAKSPRADGNYMHGYEDGFATLAPVMSYTPNRLGLYDLGGNVAEWVADWSDATKQNRVLRGAGHSQGIRAGLLSSARSFAAPSGNNPGHGFRVVVVPPAPVSRTTWK
jgi:formylglycine-generating enzyme required for sulfatase activity